MILCLEYMITLGIESTAHTFGIESILTEGFI